MGKIACSECGKTTDAAKARVCYGCDTALCARCAAKKQSICAHCFGYMGYVN